ncbi:hypothetical protein CVD28_25700 [Bacillus sp. M6-12]|nr:hypothetical protein CVD28_25700 [Bacillus sp. M6-12]
MESKHSELYTDVESAALAIDKLINNNLEATLIKNNGFLHRAAGTGVNHPLTTHAAEMHHRDGK